MQSLFRHLGTCTPGACRMLYSTNHSNSFWPMEQKVKRSSATSGDTHFLENMCIIGDGWDWAVRWLSKASFLVCAWMFAACFIASRVAHVTVFHLCRTFLWSWWRNHLALVHSEYKLLPESPRLVSRSHWLHESVEVFKKHGMLFCYVWQELLQVSVTLLLSGWCWKGLEPFI